MRFQDTPTAGMDKREGRGVREGMVDAEDASLQNALDQAGGEVA